MRKWGWIWEPTYGPRWSNELYEKKEDPYHFNDSPYETEKYAHMMRLLNGRTYGSALEIGAAEGAFTQLLAPSCSSYLAIEVAEAAVARAKDRLAGYANVTFVHAALPNQMPDGKFDLIIASDVLYYFPKDVLLDLTCRFEEALEPGGLLFAQHYLGNFGQTIVGHKTHDLMKSHSVLEVIHDETVTEVGPEGKGYTITIFQKPD